MSELKPCPFCGGKAERGTITHAYGHTQYYVYCFVDSFKWGEATHWMPLPELPIVDKQN